MSNLDTLVEISKVARLFAGDLLYRRLVSNLVAVVLLTVITGMLMGALLMGGLYFACVTLIRHGVDPDTAMLAIGGMVALIGVIFAALTSCFIRKLRHTLVPVPALARIKDIATAFADGLTESRAEEKH